MTLQIGRFTPYENLASRAFAAPSSTQQLAPPPGGEAARSTVRGDRDDRRRRSARPHRGGARDGGPRPRSACEQLHAAQPRTALLARRGVRTASSSRSVTSKATCSRPSRPRRPWTSCPAPSSKEPPMPITLTGLASGLDTESIISQLMAIEQNKVTAVQRRQIAVKQHKTDLHDDQDQARRLQDRGRRPGRRATWKPAQTTSSSDPTKVDVTLLGGAGIGGHSLQVNKLASSAQHGFTYTPSATAGKITLFYGTDPNAAGNSKLDDRRRGQRHRDRRRDGDQRQRGLARVRGRRQGRRRRAPRLLRAQDRRELGLHRRHVRCSPAATLTEVPAYARTGTTLNAVVHRSTARRRRARRSPTSSRTRSRACA